MPQLRSLAAAAVTLTLLGACGSGATSSPPADGKDSAGEPGRNGAKAAGAGNVALYDDRVVHDIAVTFDTKAYDEMIAAYASSQDKEWISATISIDGVGLDNVGMRLKGNSSLRSLANRNNGGATSTTPQSLPWLVRFDKYVDGQSYQGYTEIVVRGNSTRTSLNEAVALEVIGLAGETTQEAFATRFSVNGSAKVLRLVIESPNDGWEEKNFDTEGVLYKAESTGDYSYRGDDPKAYDEVFDQETDTDNEDLTPLIDFLEFINTSSDAAFAAGLGQRFDVNAFARYLALQDLVGNFDDIDGPGNNSYLRYDGKTKKFTVLSWDLNLAYGATPGGMGGAAGPGGMVRPPGPPGGQAPAGGQVPPGGAGGAGPRGGPGGRSNVLVQRFQANATFAALVTQAKADLTAQLYTSGKAAQVLTRWTDVLKAHATDLVDVATIDREAANIRQRLG